MLGLLDQAGIEKTLITGFDEFSSVHETFIPNEWSPRLAERHPDRFIPFAGADVPTGMDAVRSFEELVRERGFRGLSVRPFMIGLPADDRRYYPLYAKCVELDVPVSIHSSANWTTVAVSDLGHPRHIDAVAADFQAEDHHEPRRLPVGAGGGLAWKYPNVYLELAAHRPRYLATPGTGWEPLLRYGTTRSATRSCSGRVVPARAAARQVVDEFRALPVPQDVLESGGCGATPRRCWARPSRPRTRSPAGPAWARAGQAGRPAAAAVAGRSTTSRSCSAGSRTLRSS